MQTKRIEFGMKEESQSMQVGALGPWDSVCFMRDLMHMKLTFDSLQVSVVLIRVRHSLIYNIIPSSLS
jgi:hypothetical protein